MNFFIKDPNLKKLLFFFWRGGGEGSGGGRWRGRGASVCEFF